MRGIVTYDYHLRFSIVKTAQVCDYADLWHPAQKRLRVASKQLREGRERLRAPRKLLRELFTLLRGGRKRRG